MKIKFILFIPLILILSACDSKVFFGNVPQNPEPTNGENITEPIEVLTNYTNETVVKVITDVNIFTPPRKNNISIYISDIDGQSLIILKDKSLLIDGGTESDAQIIIKNLRNVGVYQLDFLVITNTKEETIGGLPYIVIQTSPAKAYETGMPSSSSSYQIYQSDLAQNGTKVPIDMVFMLDDIFIKLIVPYDDGQGFIGTQEDNSIPVKITYGSNVFLYMSNCHFKCIERIQDASLKANVLIIDGSCDSTTLSFLQKVNPEVVVVTGDLCSLTEDRFTFLDIPMYTTKEHGDIRLESDRNDFYLKYLKTRIE